jgi:hypothetical protein
MRYITIGIILISLFACRSKRPSAQKGDKELTIQATKIEADQESGEEYRVRIFTGNKMDNAAGKKVNESMQMGADSLFFRISNGLKEYPQAVIPVAASIKHSYEYILIFSGTHAENQDNEKLIYQDKYINGKTYELSLK